MRPACPRFVAGPAAASLLCSGVLGLPYRNDAVRSLAHPFAEQSLMPVCARASGGRCPLFCVDIVALSLYIVTAKGGYGVLALPECGQCPFRGAGCAGARVQAGMRSRCRRRRFPRFCRDMPWAAIWVALWRVPRSVCMPPHAFCAICAVGYRCGNRCLWWCAAGRPGVAVMAFPAVRSERGAIHAVVSRAFVDKGR